MKISMRVLCFSTLLLFSLHLHAQKITWGELNTAEKASITPNILGQDEEHIYVVDYIEKKWNLKKFDNKKFKQVYSTEIVLPEISGKETDLEQLVLMKGNIIAFYSGYDKATEEAVIHAMTVDLKTGKTNKKSIELMTVSVEKKSRSGSFFCYTSSDNSKLLVEHFAYYKKEKRYRDRYLLLDNALNVITSKEEVIEKDGENYSTSNYIIDDEGSYYFLKKTGDENYIVSYDATKDYEKWEEKITVEGMKTDSRITGVRFVISQENDLILTGLYEEESETMLGLFKPHLLKGCFFSKVDFISKEIEVSKLTRFSDDFLNQFQTKKDEKKGRDAKVNSNFHRAALYTLADGGLILTAEQFESEYVESGNGQVMGYQETFGNIISLKFDANGNLAWSNMLRKNQYYYIDYYYSKFFLFLIRLGSFGITSGGYAEHYMDHWSFLAAGDKKEYCIFYNENPKNLELTSNTAKLKPAMNVKKSVTMKCSIDLKTGEMKKEPFFEAKDYSVYLKTRPMFQQDQGSELYVFGQAGKKYRFGRIDF